MDESVRQLLFWFVTAAVAVAYAWMLRMEARGQRHDRELGDLKLHVAETYAPNADLRDVSNKLDQALAILHRLQGRQESAGG